MTRDIQYLQLGNSVEGCLHCEVASLLRLLLAGRYHAGEVTTAAELHAALRRLVDEVGTQILELTDGGMKN